VWRQPIVIKFKLMSPSSHIYTESPVPGLSSGTPDFRRLARGRLVACLRGGGLSVLCVTLRSSAIVAELTEGNSTTMRHYWVFHFCYTMHFYWTIMVGWWTVCRHNQCHWYSIIVPCATWMVIVPECCCSLLRNKMNTIQEIILFKRTYQLDSN
jgi:hypothetical protein